MIQTDKQIEMTDEQMLEVLKWNRDRIAPMLEYGLLLDEESAKIRGYNVGQSNYNSKIQQSWCIWKEYKLGPWSADINKRVLRTKAENGMTYWEARKMDMEKIQHIAAEIARQCQINIEKEKNGISVPPELNRI